MLMRDDKKRSVSVIMSKLMKDKPESETMTEAPTQDGVQTDDSVAVETAAEELMSAFESKSPKAFVEAFKSLLELCGSSEPEAAE